MDDLERIRQEFIDRASDHYNDGDARDGARDKPSVGPSDRRPISHEGVALIDHRPSIPGPSVQRPTFHQGFAKDFHEVSWSDHRPSQKPTFQELGFAEVFPEVALSDHGLFQRPTFAEGFTAGLAELVQRWSDHIQANIPIIIPPNCSPIPATQGDAQDSPSITDGTDHDIIDLPYIDFFNTLGDDFHDSDLD